MGLCHRYCILVSDKPVIVSATDKEAPETAGPAVLPETAKDTKTTELAVIGEAPPATGDPASRAHLGPLGPLSSRLRGTWTVTLT